jgi:hypothetical protein
MEKSTEYDGIYLAYFTGETGTSLGIFMLKDRVLTGGDLGGGLYDGNVAVDTAEMIVTGSIKFRMQTGGTSITGARSDLPIEYDTDVSLTLPLERVAYHSISTIAGPVNVRFEKVRSL